MSASSPSPTASPTPPALPWPPEVIQHRINNPQAKVDDLAEVWTEATRSELRRRSRNPEDWTGIRPRFKPAPGKGDTKLLADATGFPILEAYVVQVTDPTGRQHQRRAATLDRAVVQRAHLRSELCSVVTLPQPTSTGSVADHSPQHLSEEQVGQLAPAIGDVADGWLARHHDAQLRRAHRNAIYPIFIGLGEERYAVLKAQGVQLPAPTEEVILGLGRAVPVARSGSAWKALLDGLRLLSKRGAGGQPILDDNGEPVRRYRASHITNTVWNGLRVFLDYAVDSGAISVNTARTFRYRKHKPARLTAMEAVEVARLTNQARVEAHVATRVALQLRTGMVAPTGARGRRAPTVAAGAGMALPDPDWLPLEADVEISERLGHGLVSTWVQEHGRPTMYRYWAVGLRAMLQVFLGCGGPRIGEVCGLMWDGIDFAARTVTFRSIYQYVSQRDRGILKHALKGKAPEDEGSDRTVSMTAEAYAALTAWRQVWEELVGRGLTVAYRQRGGLVFPSLTGRVIHPTDGNKLLRGLEARAGVRVLRSHCFRATVLTLSNLYGRDHDVTVADLAASSGNTPQTVLEVYVRPLAHNRERTRDVMEEALEVGQRRLRVPSEIGSGAPIVALHREGA